jgi:hypothetical protein
VNADKGDACSTMRDRAKEAERFMMKEKLQR